MAQTDTRDTNEDFIGAWLGEFDLTPAEFNHTFAGYSSLALHRSPLSYRYLGRLRIITESVSKAKRRKYVAFLRTECRNPAHCPCWSNNIC